VRGKLQHFDFNSNHSFKIDHLTLSAMWSLFYSEEDKIPWRYIHPVK